MPTYKAKADAQARGKDFTPIQAEVESQIANKNSFLAFGTVEGTRDAQNSGIIWVRSAAFGTADAQPCSYVAPVGGGGSGFFAIPGLGATVLIGSTSFTDPVCKYFWMGCLYAAGGTEQQNSKSQPYFTDEARKNLVRTVVDDGDDTGDEEKDTPGNPDAQEVYGTSDTPDSYIIKHPSGHKFVMSDINNEIVKKEILLKTAENKRLILSDSPPSAGGDNIILIDENDNQIRISSLGNKDKDIGPDSIIAQATGDIDLISLENGVEITATARSDKNIEINNAGTGDIVIDSKGGAVTINAAATGEIALKCGASTITMTATSISIDSPAVNITGSTGDVMVMAKSLVTHVHGPTATIFPTTPPI